MDRLRAALAEAVPFIDHEARSYGSPYAHAALRLLERINDLGVPWSWVPRKDEGDE